jgi:Uracil DNA glycosylase superfamily
LNIDVSRESTKWTFPSFHQIQVIANGQIATEQEVIVSDDYNATCNELRKLYSNLFSAATTLPQPLVDRLGCPFLPFPREAWCEATRRILVVGQEPFDYGFATGLNYSWPHPTIWSLPDALAYPESVEALTWAYKMSMYDIESPYGRKPFEQACDLLTAAANRDGRGDVLVTNLFRCILSIDNDPDSRSPLHGSTDELQQILDWQRGTLRAEVRILKPTHVVLFTGPNYDTVLRDEFNGLELHVVDERPCREFAKAVHEALPDYAIRTYHPGYLRRKRTRWSWITQIASEI